MNGTYSQQEGADPALPSPLILSVPDRTVMEIMGWSHSATAARYPYFTSAVRHDIAEQGHQQRTTAPQNSNGEQPVLVMRPWPELSRWRKRRDSNPRVVAHLSLSRRVH